MNNNFSIITASYNSAIELEKTIISVLKLDYEGEKLEYIVVDGDSKDNTKDILKFYENKFKEKKISYKWISERDRGIYDALNKAKKMVTKENAFVVCINAGDKILNLKLLKNIDAEVIFTSLYALVNKKYKKYEISKYEKIDEKNYLKAKLHHQSFFIRRKYLEDYFIDVGETADNLLMIRAINNENYKKIFLTDTYTSLFTLGGVSDQRNFNRIKSYVKTIKKYNLLIENKLNLLKLIIYNIPSIIKLVLRAILPNKIYNIRRRMLRL